MLKNSWKQTNEVESARPTLEKKWFPPPSQCVKLNIAWKRFPTRKSVGVGSVIRDSAGVLMAAHCEALQQNGDSLHMAASAVIKALTICKDAGFVDVLVEFSHPLLKALIMSKEECLTELHDSINCIRNFQTIFNSLEFFVIPCSCNKAAMRMAIFAKETTEPSVWMEEGPAVLLPIVLVELS
jgi:hypothetical protein